MAKITEIPTYLDERGELSVIEYSKLPFEIKRTYYIYNVDNSERAKHKHKITRQLLICLNGSCEVYINNGKSESTFTLNKPSIGLIVEPEDWHTVKNFTPNSTLMVLASEPFDENDYIFEPY